MSNDPNHQEARNMELPSHPEADEPTAGRQRSTRSSWVTWLVFGVIAVVVILIVILHVTGVVGPGTQ
jgi:hypothetical protein